MFRIGSKVVIVASTKKKGTGPKRGSECYIGDEKAFGIFPNFGIVASIFEVFFCKYGFEKKRRSERKRVIFVYPIAEKSNSSIEQQIRSLVKRVNSPKSESVWNKVRESFDVMMSTQIVIGVPALNKITNLNEVAEEEFMAWTESIFSSSTFCEFVFELTKTGHFNNAKEPRLRSVQNVVNLRSIFSVNKSQKDELVSQMIMSYGGKVQLIEIIRLFLAFENSRRDRLVMFAISFDHIFSSLVESYKKRDEIPVRSDVITTLFSKIYPNIFEEKLLNLIKHKFEHNRIVSSMITDSKEACKKVNEVLKEEVTNISKMSAGLLGFSSRLLSLHGRK